MEILSECYYALKNNQLLIISHDTYNETVHNYSSTAQARTQIPHKVQKQWHTQHGNMVSSNYKQYVNEASPYSKINNEHKSKAQVHPVSILHHAQ